MMKYRRTFVAIYEWEKGRKGMQRAKIHDEADIPLRIGLHCPSGGGARKNAPGDTMASSGGLVRGGLKPSHCCHAFAIMHDAHG